MKEAKGDMLKAEGDVHVITTNGFVTKTGNAVMGRGCAKQASEIIPDLKATLGKLIECKGNIVHFINPIVTFPVKPVRVVNDGTNVVRHCKTRIGQSTPGFHAKANKEIIFKSVQELLVMAELYPWDTIICPRFGCGAGELDWETEVKPMVEDLLDDRFIIYTF